MLRSFTALLLIFTILTANFTRQFVYAGFELNKNYIATKLCENRDKPWMNCNGKCYLAKKLKQALEKEKSQERETQKSSFQPALLTAKTTIDFPVLLLQVFAGVDLPFALPQRAATIFQPPKLA